MTANSAGVPVPESVALALGRTFDAADEAITITTTDDSGWPRTAMLSLAEVALTNHGRVAILLFDGSTSAANLRRNGRLLLTVAAGGVVYDLKFNVQEQGRPLPNPARTTFTGMLCALREQRAAYATVTSGIRFTLNDTEKVLPRWQDQLTHLRDVLNSA
ncbi:hypothetical protein [Arthrobacter sp. M4]|uniref:hypothetical protein n=1 Tax=Arthrobacter sp. M4 TaxID=218160 RepID=UPI001CDBD254|nr:hypothetical protein [Arthrobacter sp. M4]MCA4132510.1 hypothetical protein [Arthrobacter sp. M4]